MPDWGHGIKLNRTLLIGFDLILILILSIIATVAFYIGWIFNVISLIILGMLQGLLNLKNLIIVLWNRRKEYVKSSK